MQHLKIVNLKKQNIVVFIIGLGSLHNLSDFFNIIGHKISIISNKYRKIKLNISKKKVIIVKKNNK